MAENVITVLFDVESEAFQAATELKSKLKCDSYTISQVELIKKQNGFIAPCDGFDSGLKTTDDTFAGLLIGSIVGILGGPLGVLIGGGYGAMVGSAVDATDAIDGLTMIEAVSEKTTEGEIALIALVQENDEAALNEFFAKYKTTIIRRDAAVVALEIEDAKKLEKELQRQAKEELRKTKKEERSQKIAEKREEIKSNFEAFKAKFKSE